MRVNNFRVLRGGEGIFKYDFKVKGRERKDSYS